MISHDMKQAILTLHQKKSKIREISLILKISRNTVRRVLRGQANQKPLTTSKYQEAYAYIKEVFQLGGEVSGLVPPAVERWMRVKQAGDRVQQGQ